MDVVGVFEAKTKFSEICQKVAATGKPCTVTRRGQPLVRIEAVREAAVPRESIWSKRERHLREHGKLAAKEADFQLLKPVGSQWRDPLKA